MNSCANYAYYCLVNECCILISSSLCIQASQYKESFERERQKRHDAAAAEQYNQLQGNTDVELRNSWEIFEETQKVLGQEIQHLKKEKRD